MLFTSESKLTSLRVLKNPELDISFFTDKSLSKAKVIEEINELIEAVEENTNKIHEAADVFYHLLIYLEANEIKVEDIMQELEKRKK